MKELSVVFAFEKYRLEYSEIDGFFHYENLNKNNKNTNGYFCICDKITITQCNEFTSQMFEKYPNINTGNDKEYPSIEIMKTEFQAFLLT